jgi:membrane protein implicated in regulation of membrane protease activity
VSPSARYWIAQIPGYLVGGIVLFVAVWFGLPGWAALAMFALLVLKDAVFYPWALRALAAPPTAGAESLRGARGVVVVALEPEGKVRVGHELWRARTAREHAPLAEGRAVRVEDVSGLTLVVAPDDAG